MSFSNDGNDNDSFDVTRTFFGEHMGVRLFGIWYLFTAFMAVGICGNVVVILILVVRWRHSTFSIFTTFLSALQLCKCLLLAPTFLHMLHHLVMGRRMGTVLCQFFQASVIFYLLSTAFVLLQAAWCHYQQVRHPSKIMAMSKIAAMPVGAIVVAGIVSIPNYNSLFISLDDQKAKHVPLVFLNTERCSLIAGYEHSTLVRLYLWVFITLYSSATVLTVIIYVFTLRKIKPIGTQSSKPNIPMSDACSLRVTPSFADLQECMQTLSSEDVYNTWSDVLERSETEWHDQDAPPTFIAKRGSEEGCFKRLEDSFPSDVDKADLGSVGRGSGQMQFVGDATDGTGLHEENSSLGKFSAKPFFNLFGPSIQQVSQEPDEHAAPLGKKGSCDTGSVFGLKLDKAESLKSKTRHSEGSCISVPSLLLQRTFTPQHSDTDDASSTDPARSEPKDRSNSADSEENDTHWATTRKKNQQPLSLLLATPESRGLPYASLTRPQRPTLAGRCSQQGRHYSDKINKEELKSTTLSKQLRRQYHTAHIPRHTRSFTFVMAHRPEDGAIPEAMAMGAENNDLTQTDSQPARHARCSRKRAAGREAALVLDPTIVTQNVSQNTRTGEEPPPSNEEGQASANVDTFDNENKLQRTGSTNRTTKEQPASEAKGEHGGETSASTMWNAVKKARRASPHKAISWRYSLTYHQESRGVMPFMRSLLFYLGQSVGFFISYMAIVLLFLNEVFDLELSSSTMYTLFFKEICYLLFFTCDIVQPALFIILNKSFRRELLEILFDIGDRISRRKTLDEPKEDAES